MALPQVGLEAVIENLAGFSKGADTVTKAYAQIDAGASQVEKSSGGLSGAFSSIGSGMLSLGKVAAGVALGGVTLLGGGLVALGAKSVLAAADVGEMQSLFNTAFGQDAPKARAEIDAFAAAVGRNKFELEGFAGGIKSLVTPMGVTTEAGNEMSIGFAKLAVDLSSFYNVTESDALESLRAGLIGETEPLRKFGVVLNAAQIEQKALNMGIFDGKGQMTAATKAAATYALIMEQTTLAQGDAARTSGSWVNQTRALKSVIDETVVSIGMELLPVVTPLLAQFTSMVKSVLPGLVDIFKNVIGTMSRLAKAFSVGFLGEAGNDFGFLGQVVAGAENALFAFVDLSDDVLDKIFAFDNAILNLAQTILGDFTGGVSSIGDLIKTALGGAIELVTTTILPALTTAIEFVNEHWEAFKGAILGVGAVLAGAAIVSAITGIVAALGAILSPIGLIIAAAAAIGAAWNTNFLGMRDTLTAFWESTAKPALQELWAWLQVSVPKAIKTASEFWESTLLPALRVTWKFINDDLIPVIQAVAGWLRKNVPAAVKAVSAVLAPIITKVLPALVDMFSIIQKWVVKNFPLMQKTISTVINFISGLFSGFSKESSKLWAKWGSTIKEAVDMVFRILKTGLQNALDLVTFIMQLITGDWEGAWETIKGVADRNLKLIVDVIKMSFNNMLKIISDIMGSILKKISDIWTSIVNVIKDKVNEAYNAVKNKFDTLASLISGYASALMNAAKKMMQGIIDGINAMLNSISSALISVMTSAINALKSALSSGSLYNLLLAAGQAIINAIKNGIAAVTDLASRLIAAVQAAINSLASSISSGALYNILINAGRNIINYIVSGINAVTNLASTLISKVQSAINSLSVSSIFNALYDVGQSIIEGIIDGVESMGSELVGVLKDIVDAAIEAILEDLGIGSPSKVFFGIGVDMMKGLQAGISALAPSVNMQLQSAVAGPAVNAPALGATGNTSIFNTFQLGGNTINSGMDQATFEARVMQAIRRNL